MCIDLFTLSAKTCPYNMEYTECASKCIKTCASMYQIPSAECQKDCYPGCRCPSGTFLHNNTCIEGADCPCVWQKQEHPSGTRIRKGCNYWCVVQLGNDILTYIDKYHISLRKKATIHQLTALLLTSKNVLFPGHNHLLTTGADGPTL